MASTEANAVEHEVQTLLGEQRGMVFCLSIDSFLKFQIKRKPLGNDGTAGFLKSARKVLLDTDTTANPDFFDGLAGASIRYARGCLATELYSAFEEEARGVVLQDFIAAFAQLTTPTPTASALAVEGESSVTVTMVEVDGSSA